MTSQRGTPHGYDWEDSSTPSEPEHRALPDRRSGPPRVEEGGPLPAGAPRFDHPEDHAGGSERTSRRLPPWSIVAIVALQVVALIATVGLVVGGVLRLVEDDPDPASAPSATRSPAQDEQERDREPGVVTTAEGTEVRDGTGSFEEPATVGEHTVSWPTWTDGTISVTVLEVDLEATLPGADGVDVAEDPYRLVAVTYEVRYEGPGQLAPVEELWLTGESDRAYYPDISEGLVPDPLSDIRPLGSGEGTEFRSVFVLPEQELESFRLGVETYSGRTLYYASR